MTTASATNKQSSIDNADSQDNVNFLSADQSNAGIDECESSDDEGDDGQYNDLPDMSPRMKTEEDSNDGEESISSCESAVCELLDQFEFRCRDKSPQYTSYPEKRPSDGQYYCLDEFNAFPDKRNNGHAWQDYI